LGVTTATDNPRREDVALRQVRRQYESRGYHFFEHPPRDLLPAFLDTYRPDALAVGPEGNVIIEVKATSGKSTEDSLARVAKLFEGQTEWAFRVIYAGAVEEFDELAPSPTRELRSVIEEAEDLLNSNHPRAALVLGWSALEGVARSLNREGAGRPRGPSELVEWMTSEGHIGQEASRKLRQLIAARNGFVHGDFTKRVSGAEVQALINEVRRLEGGLHRAKEAV
jgi:uncharacterized protein YutE (UPF0331/DUF86 family)